MPSAAQLILALFMLPFLVFAGKAIPANVIPGKKSASSPKTIRDSTTETGADMSMLVYGFFEFEKSSLDKSSPEQSEQRSRVSAFKRTRNTKK